MRRVGILGGMGPEATILLMQKVLQSVTVTDDADHVPLLIDQNPQVPSRIGHLLEGAAEDPGAVLADRAVHLVQAGAQALAMPCNTAHHYAPAIRAAVNVPFLDMVELAVSHAASLTGPGGTVGILGSPALHKIGLFDAALARHGLIGCYAAQEDQMLAAIRQVKALGPQPQARATLAEASVGLCRNGAAVQMIACTEFSLISEAVSPDAVTFDTLDLLVRDIVSFARRHG